MSPSNTAAKEITRSLALLAGSDLRPNEVGSPWSEFDGYHGHFTNSLHKDHLHIGYHQAPSVATLQLLSGDS